MGEGRSQECPHRVLLGYNSPLFLYIPQSWGERVLKKKRNKGSDREVNNKLDRGTHRVPAVSCLGFVGACFFFFVIT